MGALFKTVRIRLAYALLLASLRAAELISPSSDSGLVFPDPDPRLNACQAGPGSFTLDLGATWVHRCRRAQTLWRILGSRTERCAGCGEISPRRQQQIDAESASTLRGAK